MIQLPIEEVVPGMVVARSVLGGVSGVQLAAGYVLDKSVILHCKRQQMRTMWVHLDGDETLPAGNVNDQLALQAQQAWKDNMGMLEKIGDTQDFALENLAKFTADTGRFKNIVATEHLKSIVDQIIRSILGQEPLMVNLASMRTKDGYLHQHALDVTITATMIASRLKYSQQDIQDMALGCFLMDLGMIIVPDSVFERKGPHTLQETHLLEEHPSVGFAILRANEGININTAHVAYQHHERLDARGYPRQLMADDISPQKTLVNSGGHIHRYAQIAAVADTYITAISPRPGSAMPMTPLEAMRLLIDEAGKGLNSHVVNALITIIPIFPTGTRIIVVKADRPMLVGHVGVVSRANIIDKERPEIILIMDKFKRRIRPIRINLVQEKGIEIQFVPLVKT
jgi:HD-GYP domain-containing protein (c-di-GMP phosphodiesterase class II)